MTSEQRYELENEKTRGEQIQGFLRNEAVQAVFKSLELSYFRAWKDAQTPAEREVVHARASAFDDLRAVMQGIVASGEMATRQLEEPSTDPDLA